jgi:hypothetical protein
MRGWRTERDRTVTDIACTLGGGAFQERLEEWRSFSRDVVTEMDSSAASVRFRLPDDDDDAVLAAVSLGQREKECCAFFDFAIELGPHDRWLVARVPPEAEEVLASFVQALSGEESESEGR